MPNPLNGWDAGGTRLSLEDYRADFRATDSMITGRDSWKLERRQHFRQPGSASWEAFARGQWAEALRLIEARRESLMEFGAKPPRKAQISTGREWWRSRSSPTCSGNCTR